ncbi:MAG: efflux RND transporter periplasmic adaptor subunit [Peptostreptococcaceae bacterium]|nr:efflux RND transporter periplasmic adaptor subunit [Peptostreptococcaceae bacterium]
MMKKFKELSKKKKIIIVISILALIIVVAAVFMMPKATKVVATTEAKATLQDISTYYSYEGNIDSAEGQIVYASNMYPVKKFYISEGDQVKKDQILLDYDNTNINTSVTSAQASLFSSQLAVTTAETNASRLTVLYNDGAVSRQEYESAVNSLASAKNQLTQTQANYQSVMNQKDETSEKAQVNGEVIEIDVAENESVTTGTKILEIVNYDTLQVSVKVDEYDVGFLSEGQKAEITVNALNEMVKGTVTKISKKADVVNGVSYFPTIITFDKPDNLRVGMSVVVKITVSSAKNVITVPYDAVQFDASNKTYVQYRDPNGDLNRAYVVLGINNGELVEIKSGIKEGTTIMVPVVSSTSNFSGGQRAGRPGNQGN